MKTRVKFVCDSIENRLSNTSKTVTLDVKPTSSFLWGSLKIGVADPKLRDFFAEGSEYILTISKA